MGKNKQKNGKKGNSKTTEIVADLNNPLAEVSVAEEEIEQIETIETPVEVIEEPIETVEISEIVEEIEEPTEIVEKPAEIVETVEIVEEPKKKSKKKSQKKTTKKEEIVEEKVEKVPSKVEIDSLPKKVKLFARFVVEKINDEEYLGFKPIPIEFWENVDFSVESTSELIKLNINMLDIRVIELFNSISFTLMLELSKIGAKQSEEILTDFAMAVMEKKEKIGYLYAIWEIFRQENK